MKGHIDDYIVPTIWIEIQSRIYPLQDSDTPLHYAVVGGRATCVEHLLSTPDSDVNIKNRVSWSSKF